MVTVSESRERVTRRGARKENDKAVNKPLADAEVKKSEPVVQKEVDPDKLPFRGFDLEKEKPLLDLIERKSAVLFEQVRKLENLKVIEAAAAITAMKKSGAVTPPPGFIEGPVESAPKIQVVRVCGQDETFQDIVANLQKPFGAGKCMFQYFNRSMQVAMPINDFLYWKSQVGHGSSSTNP